MKTIALGALAATLMASAASAAPLAPAVVASTQVAGIEQVRLVCDEYGRCFRSRGPRYVQRYYDGDDGYVARRSYGYHGGPVTTIAGMAITEAGRASASASVLAAGNDVMAPPFGAALL